MSKSATSKQSSMVSAMICIILMAACLYKLPVASFRFGYQILTLYWCCIIISALLISDGHKIAGLLLLLAGIQTQYPALSLTSLEALRYIIIGILAYYAACKLGIDLDHWCITLIIICTCHCAFLLTQQLKLCDIYLFYGLKTNLSITGLCANPNEASAMAALCLPAFLRFKWSKWLLPIPAACLAMSASSGGLFAAAAILVAYCYIHRIKWVLIPGGIGILAFFGYIDKPDFSDRGELWLQMIRVYFDEGFWFGFGTGHFPVIAKEFLPKAIDGTYFHDAHNEFLQSWFEWGMGFIILLIAYSVQVIRRIAGHPCLIYAAISVVCVCSTNSTIRINYLNGMIVLVWLAIIDVHGVNKPEIRGIL